MTSARIPEGGVALVLSGAVAKGAFSVGAIGEFAARGWPIRRIAATSSGALTAAVLGALGWRDLRLILVCPDIPLPGTALSAFADRNLRQAYIEAGRVAAQKALER